MERGKTARGKSDQARARQFRSSHNFNEQLATVAQTFEPHGNCRIVIITSWTILHLCEALQMRLAPVYLFIDWKTFNISGKNEQLFILKSPDRFANQIDTFRTLIFMKFVGFFLPFEISGFLKEESIFCQISVTLKINYASLLMQRANDAGIRGASSSIVATNLQLQVL